MAGIFCLIVIGIDHYSTVYSNLKLLGKPVWLNINLCY